MAVRLNLGIAGVLCCACTRGPADGGLPARPASQPDVASVAESSSGPAPAELRGAQRGSSLEPGMFHLRDLGPQPDGAAHYVASVEASPRVCQFELVIVGGKVRDGVPFSIAQATLVRRPAADCAAFLKVLAKRLAFTGELPRPKPVERLSASIAILGTNQSRRPAGEIGGSFSSTPPGHWTAAKLFLADGEAEVFLNIDAHDGVGEFSIKDEDYAAAVVTELGKILLPDAG